MSTIYFDTSAINSLFDDTDRNLLLRILAYNTCTISAYTVLELASTTNDEKRTHLLAFTKGLIGNCHPFAKAGQILSRCVTAFISGNGNITASMGTDGDQLWDILCDPTMINKDSLVELKEMKAKEEKWYQDMLDNARLHIQKEISELPKKDQEWIKKSPSKLLKHYSQNRDFMIESIQALYSRNANISKELAENILDHSEPWRFYIAGIGYGIFCRSIKTNKYGKDSNPGSIDTQQAIYLSGCDIFVTNDLGKEPGPWYGQIALLRTILPFGFKPRRVWHFKKLKEECLIVANRMGMYSNPQTIG